MTIEIVPDSEFEIKFSALRFLNTNNFGGWRPREKFHVFRDFLVKRLGEPLL